MMIIMRAKVSDYINAGNIAARQSLDIQAAAIRSGSNIEDITKEAQRQRILTEIAGRKAGANVHLAGMDKDARVKAAKDIVDREEREVNRAKSRRKAGSVAAAGMLVAAGLDKKPERIKRKPTDYSALDASLASRRTAAEEALAAAQKAESDYLAKQTAPAAAPISAPLDARQRALTETISFAEGTWNPETQSIGYNIAFGGGTYDNSLPHPDRVIHSDRVSSAAHGAGQFMPATWMDINNGQNLPMTPANQDAAMIKLAERRGYDFNKPFDSQISILAPEWASFPNEQGRSQYNLDDGTPQPSKRASDLINFYNQRLGLLSGQ